MARTYRTPGVYIEEISKFPPSVAPVATAIPAFIGYTEIAKDKVVDDLRLKPKRIVSMLEYETYFGQPQKEEKIEVIITETREGKIDGPLLATASIAQFASGSPNRSRHLMYYALQSYFANGGGPCYIVSVGGYGEFGLDIDPGQSDPPTFLYEGLAALEKEDEPTLIVFPESQGIRSLSDQGALHDAALQQCEKLKDRFVVMSLQDHNKDSKILELVDGDEAFRSKGVGIGNLKYGAVYAPNIETIFNYAYDETKVTVRKDITVVNPTETSTDDGDKEGISMEKLKEFKELKDSDRTEDVPKDADAQYARAKAAIDQMPLVLPPAPAVVGVYARVDGTRGVWKAPANVSLNNVIKPVIQVTNDQQDRLNIDENAGKSINVIRPFTGKGTLIWGARTLAGNDNEWRYIPVRRFFNFAEESIKKATEQFVFEPNDSNTWVRLRGMIENFLKLQWQAGALAGAKPEQAFFVNVGLNQTMTATDILEGRMIVEIGMAVVRPAEFIILRFSHKMQES